MVPYLIMYLIDDGAITPLPCRLSSKSTCFGMYERRTTKATNANVAARRLWKLVRAKVKRTSVADHGGIGEGRLSRSVRSVRRSQIGVTSLDLRPKRSRVSGHHGVESVVRSSQTICFTIARDDLRERL